MGNFCSGPMVNDRPAEFTTDIKSNNVVASPPHVEQLAEVPPEHHPHVSDPNVRPPSPSILEGRSHSYHNACGPDSKHKQLSLPQIDVLLALGNTADQTVNINTQKKTEENNNSLLAVIQPETVAIENLPPPSPLLEHVDAGDAVEDNTPTEVEEEEPKPEPPVVDDTTTTASASVDEPEGHDDVPPTLSTHEPDVEQLATESQEQDDDSEFPPPVTIAEPDTEEDLDVPASMHQHEATPPVSDDEE